MRRMRKRKNRDKRGKEKLGNALDEMERVRTTDRGGRKKYRWVGHQLLNEKSPVVEVVVHSEVARLIDVSQQPHLAAHVTHSVSLYKYSRKKEHETDV